MRCDHFQSLLGPLVPYVIQALAHEVLGVCAVADFRVGDAHIFGIELFSRRGNARIGKYQILRHAFEHLVDGPLNFGVTVNSCVLNHDAHIGEAACDLRCPDGGVGDVEPLKNIDHVVPALKWHQGVTLSKSSCLFGCFLAVAVIRLGPVSDSLCLA